jgi:aspartate aminotransferase
MNVVLSLLEQGDEVLIPAPYWVSYPEMVKLAGAETTIIPSTVENEYKITPEDLEKVITPKTRAFIYSSPSNPTGSLYTKEELAGLAEVFSRHPNVIIISDEIYELINFTGEPHASLAHFPEIADRVVVVNGMSKGFAMTGWRIGYMAAPAWLAAACDKVQSQFTSGACSIAQRASLAALTSPYDASYAMRDAFRRRRDLMFEKLSGIEGLQLSRPEGAFYLFPKISSFFGKEYNGHQINTADDLSMYLVNEAQVSTVAGTGFGAPECIRLSYAASETELLKAATRIEDALSKLK